MVEQAVAAKMPRSRRKDDISEKDEFHLPQIVSRDLGSLVTSPDSNFVLQPEEEIQKYMIEEDLSECERIKLLLEKRDPNQYGYVFLNAVSIFRDDLEM